ncbi:MAG: sigma-70 family RNA polymerase sigma factor, partial [Candidatus Sumerlaeota bacterium]
MPDQLAQTLAPDVRLAASGSVDAFTRLVDRTSGMVCSITLAIARNVEDSEDIAQEVYVAAWQSLPKLNNPASFLPWLRQTARNRARHSARTHVRASRRRVGNAEEIENAFATAADSRPTAPQALMAQEDRAALEEAMSVLPDEAREIVALYYREGQSVRTVAELLELSEDAVKKRLQRARETLRAELLDRAGDALKKSGPGAALTTAVIAALAVGAPAGATAGGITLGGAGIASKGTPILKLLGLSGGVLGGVLGGIVGGAGAFLLGAHRDRRRIRNERDRKRMGRLGIAGSVLAVVACLSLVYGYRI